MSELYEIENPTVKSLMRDIGKRIGEVLPKGWGFLLHIFEFGTPENPGATFYISNADRGDAIKMLKEWMAKQNGDEINPDHPTTRALNQQWHKIAALLLVKIGEGDPGRERAVFTTADFEALGARNISVAAKDENGGLTISIVETDEARRLAAEGLAEEGTL